MLDNNHEKVDAAPSSSDSEDSDSTLEALAPTASRRAPKIAESDAAMAQGEWIAEADVQVSRQVSRQISRRGVEDAAPDLSDVTDNDNEKEKDDDDDDDNFPDGGVDAWLVVLGAWCVSFCSFGWINSKFLVFFFFLFLETQWMAPFGVVGGGVFNEIQ